MKVILISQRKNLVQIFIRKKKLIKNMERVLQGALCKQYGHLGYFQYYR